MVGISTTLRVFVGREVVGLDLFFGFLFFFFFLFLVGHGFSFPGSLFGLFVVSVVSVEPNAFNEILPCKASKIYSSLEVALVLVCPDHVARFIVNVNHAPRRKLSRVPRLFR
jgi:hypothetical protein